MSEHGELRFGADGFVDMDLFDATEPSEALDAEVAARLHDVLVRAPVPTPSPSRFDELVERTLEDANPVDTAWLVPEDAAPLDLADEAPHAEYVDIRTPESEGTNLWDDLGPAADPEHDVNLDDALDQGDPG